LTGFWLKLELYPVACVCVCVCVCVCAGGYVGCEVWPYVDL